MVNSGEMPEEKNAALASFEGKSPNGPDVDPDLVQNRTGLLTKWTNEQHSVNPTLCEI